VTVQPKHTMWRIGENGKLHTVDWRKHNTAADRMAVQKTYNTNPNKYFSDKDRGYGKLTNCNEFTFGGFDERKS